MRKTLSRCAFLLLLVSTTAVSHLPAQETQPAAEAAKVLVIQREMTKPGKEGAAHEATEAAYSRALADGKGKQRYIALTSLSGQYRALFVSSYPSFAAMEAERKAMTPELTAALDKANVADGDVLSETGQSVWIRRDDLSSNIKGMGAGARYMEVSQYVLKPGHRKEWEDLVQSYKQAAANVPEFHWTTYELAYGGLTGPAYVVLTSLKSMSEIDSETAAGKKFDEALGESGRKKMADLEGTCIQTEMTNLFVINPRMSMPPEEALQAEPEFWKPEASAVATKK